MKKACKAEENHKHFRAAACCRGKMESHQFKREQAPSNALHSTNIQGR
jgi:hypothetical protein